MDRAIRNNCFPTVQLLVEKYRNLDELISNAIQAAIKNNRKEIYSYLIKQR